MSDRGQKTYTIWTDFKQYILKETEIHNSALMNDKSYQQATLGLGSEKFYRIHIFFYKIIENASNVLFIRVVTLFF